MNVIDITITSVEDVTHDDYNNVLALRLGNGTSIRIEGNAFGAVREALPGGNADVSDLKDKLDHLRYELEQSQSEAQAIASDVESSLGDAQSRIEDLGPIADCHSDLGSALSDLESALDEIG